MISFRWAPNPLHIMVFSGDNCAHLSTIVLTGLCFLVCLYFLRKNTPLHISGIIGMGLTIIGLNTAEIFYGVIRVGVKEMTGTILLYGMTVIGVGALLVTVDSYYPFFELKRRTAVFIILQVLAFCWLHQTGYFVNATEWINAGLPPGGDPSNLAWFVTKVLSYCIPISVIRRGEHNVGCYSPD